MLTTGCEAVSGLDDFSPPDGAGPAGAPSGLVMMYPLDEADGGSNPTLARDAGPHGVDLDLVYENNLEYVESRGDRGLDWEQDNGGGRVERLLTGAPLERLGGRQLSIELVVDIDDGSSSCPRMLHIGAPNDSGSIALCVTGGGRIAMRLDEDERVGSEQDIRGARRVLHAVVNIDLPSEERVRIYVDGQNSTYDIGRDVEQPPSLGEAPTFTIGNRGAGDRAIDGRIFFVALYDRALTPVEVEQRAGLLTEQGDL